MIAAAGQRETRGRSSGSKPARDCSNSPAANLEAEIPATVYEPGVLFLRITLFRMIVDTLKDEKTLAVQVNGDGLLIDAVRMPLEGYDMLLYPNPDGAPKIHPADVMAEAERLAEERCQLNLFGVLPKEKRTDSATPSSSDG
jgi:hypothetical protein